MDQSDVILLKQMLIKSREKRLYYYSIFFHILFICLFIILTFFTIQLWNKYAPYYRKKKEKETQLEKRFKNALYKRTYENDFLKI